MIKPKSNISVFGKNTHLNLIDNEGFLYINSTNVNKKNCLKRILEIMKINVNETLIAGNAKNDHEMLKSNSNYKYYVGNKFKERVKKLMNINFVSTPKALGKQLQKL